MRAFIPSPDTVGFLHLLCATLMSGKGAVNPCVRKQALCLCCKESGLQQDRRLPLHQTGREALSAEVTLRVTLLSWKQLARGEGQVVCTSVQNSHLVPWTS